MQRIKPLHLELLSERIHQGRCVPFLGAAVNVTSAARGYDGLPLGIEVARELVRRMGLKDRDFEGLELDLDLAKVALEFEHWTDRPHLIETLEQIIPDREREPSPLLRTLARLPFKLIVTTNYDRLMERALEEVHRPYVVLYQRTRGAPLEAVLELEETLAATEHLVLYKLHGSFVQAEELSSDLIITEDDYIDFLAVSLTGGGVPRRILSSIVDSALLVLGYSVKDWDFRMIYRSLPMRDMRRAFVILKADTSTFWLEYLMRSGFFVYSFDIYDFAEQLEDSYVAAYGQ